MVIIINDLFIKLIFACCFLICILSSDKLFSTDFKKIDRETHEYKVLDSSEHARIFRAAYGGEIVHSPLGMITGYSKQRLTFHFCCFKGSWDEHLTASNSYEDCLAEDFYKYLQSDFQVSVMFSYGVSYSNISEVTCSNRKGIYYINGSFCYPPPYKAYDQGYFRLYMMPTKDQKSTYFLFIKKRIAFSPNPRKENNINKSFDSVFSMIHSLNLNKRNLSSMDF